MIMVKTNRLFKGGDVTVCLAGLHNKGRLNRVFELAGVAYGSRLVLGTDAFTKASNKRKIDDTGKTPTGKVSAKRAKVPGKKNVDPLKNVVPLTKSGSR
jgi:hypothetical protein